MEKLSVNEYGSVIYGNDVLLLTGVAIPCGNNNDGKANAAEMVKRWNMHDEMYNVLGEFIKLVENDSSEDFLYKYQEIKQLLAKARGE